MPFTVKPNKHNIQRIKENSDKDALKGKPVALDNLKPDIGSLSESTKAKMPKKPLTYNKQKPLPRGNNQRGR